MAWAFVQGIGATSWTTGAGTAGSDNPGVSSTKTLTFASNNQAGNTLVAATCTFNTPASPTSISDTQGNTWVHIAAVIDANTNANAWYCLSCAGGANTITFTYGGGAKPYWEYVALEYSGGNTPTLESSGSFVDASSATAHSVSTSGSLSAGDLIVAVYGDGSVGLTFSGLSYTNRASDNTHNEILVQDNLSASSGIATATVTTSTSTVGGSIIMGFKAGAVAANPFPAGYLNRKQQGTLACL